MIAKIFKSNSTFNSIDYNFKKVDIGDAEICSMNNMYLNPNNINSNTVKKYFLNYTSTTNRIKNKEFHAVISSYGTDYSKEILDEISNKYMKELGYKDQPYITFFHRDTKNNHIHIISSRVNEVGKKISDKFENTRSLSAINKVTKRIGKDVNKLENLLEFTAKNFNDTRLLLRRNGFITNIDTNNKLTISKTNLQISKYISDETSKKYAENTPYYSDIIQHKLNNIRSLNVDNTLKSSTRYYKSDFLDSAKSHEKIDILFYTHKNKITNFVAIDYENKFVLNGQDANFNLHEYLKIHDSIFNNNKSSNEDENILDTKNNSYITTVNDFNLLVEKHLQNNYSYSNNKFIENQDDDEDRSRIKKNINKLKK